MSFSSPNYQSACPFCDKCDRQYLRITWAFDIDWRVCEGPVLLNDEKLTAKLNEGDIHAPEAKYHTNYLCNFYSKIRTIKKQNKKYYENCITYSIVLSEVVNFVKKILKISQIIPTFLFSDLKLMFLKYMQLHWYFNRISPCTIERKPFF